MSVENFTYFNESAPSYDGDPDDDFKIYTRPRTNTYVQIPNTFIICLGFVFNTMVIYIVIRYKDMHSSINYSFCILAATDLMFLSAHGLPNVLKHSGVFVAGKGLCKLTYYLRSVRIFFIHLHI